MNEVVKFLINTPVEVILQSEVGTRVKGRYGEQVMYALADDRVMYVPPYVEQRLQELAIGAGEPLLLCKREVKEGGSRNRIEWSVRRAPEQPPAPANGMIVADGVTASATALDGQPAGEMGKEMIREEEQPSGNSTAPMVRQSAGTDNQYQRQDSAPASTTEIVHVPSATTRAVELSSKDRMFLPAMSMEVAVARRSAIVEFTRRIMVKDQDFGEIPGTSKPTLLKPGAEKLCNFFGLEPEFTPIVEDIDWTGAQHGGELFCYARYRCRLLREGRVVGVGEGSSNSWEAKYRYRWVAEDQVLEHLDRTNLPKRIVRRTLCEFDFAIERAETTGTYGRPAEHWQKFRDAIHNKRARPVEKLTRRGKSVAWEIDIDTMVYRIPNPAVADVVNTIQKMAQKRALVAATLIATSASEFFTQDVEDTDVSGRNLEISAQSLGTKEAPEYGGNKPELRSKPSIPVPDPEVKPWQNFGEMRRMFEQMREHVGETRYLEEMELAGVQNPGQFQSASHALASYWRLARMAEPEVA